MSFKEKLKKTRRIIVAIIGFTILGIGVLLIFFPGPAFIVIPIGLSVLATEFLWAKKLLEKIKNKISRDRKADKRK